MKNLSEFEILTHVSFIKELGIDKQIKGSPSLHLKSLWFT